MKTCNNCDTTNVDSAVKCVHCNMEGQFTFQGLPIKKADSETVIRHCLNCGTMETGSGAKCMECNFPLPVNLTLKNPASTISATQNLKVG